MERRRKGTTKGAVVAAANRAVVRNARCIAVARRGIKTSTDFKAYMSGLMSDLIEGKVAPQVGNAACNAGGKLLKVVEMEYKYGQPSRTAPGRQLQLASA